MLRPELGFGLLQVLLRWALQLGCAVVPKSGDAKHQHENRDLFDFELTEAEMGRLAELAQQKEGQNTMIGWLREYDPDWY